MLQLSTNSFFGMVFEHLWDCFHPKDFTSGFPQLFQLCYHIMQGHIPCWIAHILGVVCLLTIIKPLSGVRPIVVKETLYWFTSRILCLQFCDAFATHLGAFIIKGTKDCMYTHKILHPHDFDITWIVRIII
jgi:hypothetical protein